jgi:hypothetical protein
METLKVYECTRCGTHSRDLWRLLKHYHAVHSCEPGFRVQCGVDNCYKSYSNVKALCAHMRVKHKEYYHEHLVSPRCSRNVEMVDDGAIDFDDTQYVNSISNDTTRTVESLSATSSANPDIISKNHIAAMSLKLREINKVPGAVCADVRQHMSSMLCESRETLKHTVLNKLLELQVPSSVCDTVCNVFACQTPYENACNSLASEYNVNRYIEEQFPWCLGVGVGLEALVTTLLLAFHQFLA